MSKQINIGYTNMVLQKINNSKILKESKGPYFHYTSLKNSLNILNCVSLDESATRQLKCSKYGIELYASHFLYLNDKEEFTNGLEKLLKVLKSQEKRYKNHSDIVCILNEYINQYNGIKSSNDSIIAGLPNHYIISFCKNGNLLGQWKFYGKDSGIAIEFDLDNCIIIGNKSKKQELVHPTQCKLYDIVYEEDTQKQKFQEAFSSFYKNEYNLRCSAMQSLMLASYMKHVSFKEEEECRLLIPLVYFPQHEDESCLLERINYRESNGIIKPYIKVQLYRCDHKNKTPIKSITVGPGENQEQIFNALILLVNSRFPKGKTSLRVLNNPNKHYDYIVVNGIEIRKSNYPFRNQ